MLLSSFRFLLYFRGFLFNFFFQLYVIMAGLHKSTSPMRKGRLVEKRDERCYRLKENRARNVENIMN